MDEQDAQVEAAAKLVAAARHVVVLTGAGISTDSGIRDFRGRNGLWTKNPDAERASDIRFYTADPEVRRRVWRSRVDSPLRDAKPNPGHLALVELERAGRLDLLVTQNVDGLHLAAGHDPSRVIEIHGTSREAVCLQCGDRMPIDVVLDRVRAGEEDPTCLLCGGILKSATISFGQQLVQADLARSEAAAANCDLLLAVGSMLTVYPAAGLVPTAARRGASIVIVNDSPTDLDMLADVVVRGSISEVLPEIVG